MTISEQDYAVLAMDAYNRGYVSPDPDDPTATPDRWLGSTAGLTPIWTSAELLDAQGQPVVTEAASFFAAAYEIDGKIVIS